MTEIFIYCIECKKQQPVSKILITPAKWVGTEDAQLAHISISCKECGSVYEV